MVQRRKRRLGFVCQRSIPPHPAILNRCIMKQQTGLTVGVKSLAVSSRYQIGATGMSLPFRAFRPDSGQMSGDEDDPAMERGL
jgi:hypothetical protein